MFCKAKVIVCITLIGLGWLFLFVNAVNGMRYYGHNGEHIVLGVVQMLTIIVFLRSGCSMAAAIFQSCSKVQNNNLL